MSRVGMKSIQIPSGVQVKIDGNKFYVKGPKGENMRPFPDQISLAIEGSEIRVSRSSEDAVSKSLHGLTRNEVQNMIIGVTQGYEKVLEISGVGYRAALQERNLTLSLGFSHPIVFPLPKGIDASIEKQTVVTIKGIDKYLVGQVAANVRAYRAPEPYKGKGVKYKGERIRRKEGKTGKGK